MQTPLEVWNGKRWGRRADRQTVASEPRGRTPAWRLLRLAGHSRRLILDHRGSRLFFRFVFRFLLLPENVHQGHTDRSREGHGDSASMGVETTQQDPQICGGLRRSADDEPGRARRQHAVARERPPTYGLGTQLAKAVAGRLLTTRQIDRDSS